ncbi:inner membrane protein [Klebsiella pneumoniae]|uniref:Inner membrane protein n=12 Tax=Gammaproteobacteria TaxID=1236 RepID=A0A377W8X5_KLEPN|nr:inner membrane protein [Klebsiella pneumoniae]
MEDITLGLFTKTRSSHARLNVPALVQVAAFAIILIRGLDLLMILNLLGLQGLNEFIHRSVQTWNLTLVFLGSLALVFIEIWCAFSLVKGRNWARWIYLLTQIIAAGYLWAASLGYGYPELFSIPGESKREIFHSLVMQKLPDLAGSDAAVRAGELPSLFPPAITVIQSPPLDFLKVNYALRTLRRRPLPLLSMAGAAGPATARR